MYTIIVATDNRGCIGKDGVLPWHNKEDLQWFKQNTENNIVVFGRKTWENLPNKILPNRITVVLSNQPWFDVMPMQDQDKLIITNKLEEIEYISKKLQKKVFICGGEQIYKLFLRENLVSKILMTQLYGYYSGDTFFPLEYLRFAKPKVVCESSDFNILEYTRHGY